MKQIYQNNAVDYSDEGEQVKEIMMLTDYWYALGDLTPDQRHILELRVEGYSVREIAEKMSASVIFVRKALAVARERISFVLR